MNHQVIIQIDKKFNEIFFEGKIEKNIERDLEIAKEENEQWIEWKKKYYSSNEFLETVF